MENDNKEDLSKSDLVSNESGEQDTCSDEDNASVDLTNLSDTHNQDSGVTDTEQDFSTETVETIIVCKNCGTECDSSQKFCVNCGNSLIPLRCPECNTEYIDGQKFCNNCGFDLFTKKCPDCGKIFPLEQKFCTACGYQFETNNNLKLVKTEPSFVATVQNDTKTNTTDFIKIFFIILMMILIVCFSILIFSNRNIQEIDISDNQNCNSQTVQNLVIDIFRENNDYYKSINSTSIANIQLSSPEQTGYDKAMDKYFCSGTIIITSKDSGFLPLSTEISNRYYSKIAHDYLYDPDEWFWERYTEYRIPVTYNVITTSDNLIKVNLKQNTSKEEFITTNGSDVMPSKKVKPLKYAPPLSDSNSNYNYDYQNNYNTYDAPTNYDYKEQVKNETNY